MKIAILLSCFTFSLVAMDNNNNAKMSYVTYERHEDKNDACILHVPKSKFEEKQDMTFVHKKGISIKQSEALQLLNTDINSLNSKAENAAIILLRNISPNSSKKFTLIAAKFKKPQVRIIKKSNINCEKFGIYGEYVDTDFLQLKITAYCWINDKPDSVRLHAYVDRDTTLTVYKVYLGSAGIYVRPERQVHYF